MQVSRQGWYLYFCGSRHLSLTCADAAQCTACDFAGLPTDRYALRISVVSAMLVCMSVNQAGRPRQSPDKEWLVKAYEQGLTYQQMADKWFKETRIRVTAGTMASAASRAGIAGQRNPRYLDYLPWSMRSEHQNSPEARALRTAKRRRRGLRTSPDQERALDLFLDMLRARDAIVFYDPDTEQGWWLVERPKGTPAVDASNPDSLRLEELPVSGRA